MSFLSKIFSSDKSAPEAERVEVAATAVEPPPSATKAAGQDENEDSPVQLTLADILLNQNAADKPAAVKLIADRMLESG